MTFNGAYGPLFFIYFFYLASKIFKKKEKKARALIFDTMIRDEEQIT